MQQQREDMNFSLLFSFSFIPLIAISFFVPSDICLTFKLCYSQCQHLKCVVRLWVQKERTQATSLTDFSTTAASFLPSDAVAFPVQLLLSEPTGNRTGWKISHWSSLGSFLLTSPSYIHRASKSIKPHIFGLFPVGSDSSSCTGNATASEGRKEAIIVEDEWGGQRCGALCY